MSSGGLRFIFKPFSLFQRVYFQKYSQVLKSNILSYPGEIKAKNNFGRATIFNFAQKFKETASASDFAKQAQQGNEAYQKKDYQAASKTFEDVLIRMIEKLEKEPTISFVPILADTFKFMWTRFAECNLRLNNTKQIIELSHRLLDSLKEREPELSAMIHVGLGDGYFSLFNINKAEENYNKALNIMQESSKMQEREFLIFNLYNGLSKVSDAKGDKEKALQLYNKVLELAEKLGNKFLIAHAKTNLGTNFAREGKITEANKYLEEALECLRDNSEQVDHTELFRTLTALAAIKEASHQFKEALKLAEEAVQKIREINNHQLLASALLSTAGLHLRVGNFIAGKKDFEEGKALIPTVQNPTMKMELEKLAKHLQDQVFQYV